MPNPSRYVLLVAISLVLTACSDGGTPPNAPSARLAITGVSPASGPTVGGISVLVSGSGFAEGAAVAFGGVAASSVAVSGPTSLTAVAPQHPAGSVDVGVSVGGVRASVPGAFTYVVPTAAANTPPRIRSIEAANRSTATPGRVANIGDIFDVRAVVEDDETPVADLQFSWSASVGGFSGDGPSVSWASPAAVAGATQARIELTVTESYASFDGQGLPTRSQHRVSSTVEISVRDLARELVDIGYLFLEDFSQQRLDPAAVVRNFSDSCRGKADELGDVVKNHREEIITEYSIGRSPSVTIAAGGVCPYYAPERQRRGDGCAWFPVVWRSILKEDGSRIYQEGFDRRPRGVRGRRVETV